MRICVYSVSCIVLLELCLTESTSLRLRIRPDKAGGKLTYVNINKIRERQKVKLSKFKRIDRSFKPLPFPVNFSLYDVNRDAKIDIKELIGVTGTAENVQTAFSASDLNGDGYVTEDEYTLSPWGYNAGDVVMNKDE